MQIAKEILIERILYSNTPCNMDDCMYCYLHYDCMTHSLNGEQRKKYAAKIFITLYGEEELFNILL